MPKYKKEFEKKFLYVSGENENSLIKDNISKISECSNYYKNFDYSNFYSVNHKIAENVIDKNLNIIVGEGLGAFCIMLLSNENIPDGHNILSRLIINPIIKPTEYLRDAGCSVKVVDTYLMSEKSVLKQAYLDVRHSFCIFSKDNETAMKYYDEFKNECPLKHIVVDTINKEFIENDLKQYINILLSGKEINIINKYESE